MTLLRITPTRLGAYVDCPRAYHLGYVAKAVKDPTPRAHLSLGNSVHLALARWWDLDDDARVAVTPRRRAGVTEPDATAREVAGSLLDGAWIDAGYRDRGHSGQWLARAKGWLARYLVTTMPVDRPRGVERTVAFVREDIAYEGRADRIDAHEGGLTVVDYKIGRRPPIREDAAGSMALAIYAYGAWRVLHSPCTSVELHHLPSGTVVEAHRDEAWLRRQIERADELVAEIRLHTDTVESGGPVDALFPPRPGPLCGSCPFRPHCPEGQGRMPAEEPWAVLDRWEWSDA